MSDYHRIARHGDLSVTKQSTSSRKHTSRLFNTSELFTSSGPSPPATSASGHATAAPASAVLELGFLPINGHTDDNRSVVLTAQSVIPYTMVCDDVGHGAAVDG